MNELLFEIKLDAAGSFFVECLKEKPADPVATDEQLRTIIKEAIHALCLGAPKPGVVRLQLLNAA